VEAYLHRLGIEQEQMAELLQRCPQLFSWPVDARASVLFGQLMGRLGMTATAAAKCFVEGPFVANARSFKPAIAVLSALLAAGSKDGKPGEQLLGEVLKDQPVAVRLLKCRTAGLHNTIDHLLQLGLDHKQLVAILHRYRGFSLFIRPPSHLAAMEAVLHRELGSGRQLWLKLLLQHPDLALSSIETFCERAQSLAAVRGLPLHAICLLYFLLDSRWFRSCFVRVAACVCQSWLLLLDVFCRSLAGMGHIS
jgi:hypothetical protein